jgi:hypothetical protein
MEEEGRDKGWQPNKFGVARLGDIVSSWVSNNLFSVFNEKRQSETTETIIKEKLTPEAREAIIAQLFKQDKNPSHWFERFPALLYDLSSINLNRFDSKLLPYLRQHASKSLRHIS